MSAKPAKGNKRKLMVDELKLPGKYLTRFHTIANETVIARHSGDPTRIRSPRIEEIRFCVFFNRMVLDRFGAHLWSSMSAELPSALRYPTGEKPPVEIFEDKNRGLSEVLERLLNGQLA